MYPVTLKQHQKSNFTQSKHTKTKLKGRMGNNLFQVGAAIVASLEEKSMPVREVSLVEYERFSYLPNVQSISICNSSLLCKHDDAEFVSRDAPYYQTSYYVQKLHEYRPDVCHYLSMEPQSLPMLPGDNDIVIYFRDFGGEFGASNAVFNVYKGKTPY